jgi:bacterioferritin-associated ferredoxin
VGLAKPASATDPRIRAGTNTGAAFCVLYGHYLPFDHATLSALYPTHGSYVSAVEAVTEANLQAGYLVPADAEITRTRAARSLVGHGNPCGAACRAARDLLEQTNYYLFTAEMGVGLANLVSGVIADISTGDGASGAPAAQSYQNARRALERFVEVVQRLEIEGAISSTSMKELSSSAAAIIVVLGSLIGG